MKKIILPLLILLISCGTPTVETKDFDYKLFSYSETYRVRESNSNSVELYISLPIDYQGRQEILSMEFHPKPVRIIKNSIESHALYKFDKITEDIEIEITSLIKVWDVDLNSLSTVTGDVKTGYISNKYIKPSEFIESDSEKIVQLSNSLVEPSDSREEMAKKFFDYSRTTLEFRDLPQDLGALAALEAGYGDCTEFSFLFAALCRVQKIPNRVVCGVSLNYANIVADHQWNEIYLDGKGWVPMDPTWADGTNPYSFENMENHFIYVALDPFEGISPGYKYTWNWYGDEVFIDRDHTMYEVVNR